MNNGEKEFKFTNQLKTFTAFRYSEKNREALKKRQWISLNSECRVVEIVNSDYIIQLKDSSDLLAVAEADFVSHFTKKTEITVDDQFEFDSKANKIKKAEIEKLVKKHFKGNDKRLLLVAIEKSYTDAYIAAGSSPFTFEEYDKHLRGELDANTLSSIGNPFFNRKARWAPVADVDLHNRTRHLQPAPTGIRASDYASLQDCNLIYMELLHQVFSMDFQSPIPAEIEVYLGKAVVKNSHKCSYCGEVMELKLWDGQSYKSKEHSINFCHRDPDDKANSTRPGNVYFGHASCNRIQGGFSEKERIIDGLRLLKLHRDEYFADEKIQNLLKEIN